MYVSEVFNKFNIYIGIRNRGYNYHTYLSSNGGLASSLSHASLENSTNVAGWFVDGRDSNAPLKHPNSCLAVKGAWKRRVIWMIDVLEKIRFFVGF